MAGSGTIRFFTGRREVGRGLLGEKTKKSPDPPASLFNSGSQNGVTVPSERRQGAGHGPPLTGAHEAIAGSENDVSKKAHVPPVPSELSVFRAPIKLPVAVS